MATFSTLTGRLLDQELGTDDSTVLFTSARREAGVNDGQREFARLTECLRIRSSITLTGGTAEYDLNSTTVLPSLRFQQWTAVPVEFRYTDASSAVTVLAGDDLPRRTVDWLHRYEPGWTDSTFTSGSPQVPTVWYERWNGPQRLLGFYPTPSSGSSALMEARVTYIGQPDDLSSTGAEPFTINSSVRYDLRPYHQALVHYAAHQLEKLRRDDQASDRQLQKFLGYVAQYWRDHRVRGGTHLAPARQYFRRGSDRGTDPRT
jgi:hypothetical protein